jgi:light-regulated signal transduction histidine kinase (bacteriophytochrome)
MSLKMGSVNINALVRDMVATFRPLTDSHRFSLDLDPSLRTIATGDVGDDDVISVRDEGVGIAREDLSRIFDRFERVEPGIAGRIAGTGLGFSIVQEIASLHGAAPGR